MLFKMRFAYFLQDKTQGVQWSGPYAIEAKDVADAKDILTDAVLQEMRVEDSRFNSIRLLTAELKENPCRGEEYHVEIKKRVADEIWRRRWWTELHNKYPEGVPKVRSLDDSWEA